MFMLSWALGHNISLITDIACSLLACTAYYVMSGRPVGWVFLQRMLFKVGFHSTWVETDEICDHVEVQDPSKWWVNWWNCSPTGIVTGEPSIPYLFLICAEAFSCLLNTVEDMLFLDKMAQHVISGQIFGEDMFFVKVIQSSTHL